MFVSVMCTVHVQLYMSGILFVWPQVDCWYVVVNGYLRYCRENEQEKHLHVGAEEGNHNRNALM